MTDLYLTGDMPQTTTDTKKAELNYEKLEPQNLQAFEGQYWDEERFTSIRIFVQNDTLMWSIDGGRERPFVPINANTFKRLSAGTNVKVAFEMEDTLKIMNII